MKPKKKINLPKSLFFDVNGKKFKAFGYDRTNNILYFKNTETGEYHSCNYDEIMKKLTPDQINTVEI